MPDDRQPGGSGAGSNPGYWVSKASLDDIAKREAQLHIDLAQSRATEAELRAVAEAGVRLHAHKYLDWANAGGPNECPHGHAESIPCRRCDGELLERFVKSALDAAEPPAGADGT